MSANIDSKGLKKLGITIKDILDVIRKEKNNGTIILKKKKRKNRKKKKKLTSSNPLVNNKPNFTSSNNQIGGGGGSGGVNSNPLNQRATPSVTTVVNTPSIPSGGQNNNNPLSQAGLVKEEKLLQLENKLNDKFKDIDKDKNNVMTTLNENRYGLYTLYNQIQNINPLSNLQSGSFRPSQPVDRNDRFGIISYNKNMQDQDDIQSTNAENNDVRDENILEVDDIANINDNINAIGEEGEKYAEIESVNPLTMESVQKLNDATNNNAKLTSDEINKQEMPSHPLITPTKVDYDKFDKELRANAKEFMPVPEYVWTAEDEEEEQRALKEVREKKKQKQDEEKVKQETKAREYADFYFQNKKKKKGQAPIGWEKYYNEMVKEEEEDDDDDDDEDEDNIYIQMGKDAAKRTQDMIARGAKSKGNPFDEDDEDEEDNNDYTEPEPKKSMASRIKKALTPKKEDEVKKKPFKVAKKK
jgi:hypothetical protein